MRYLKTNTATIVTVGPFFDKTDGVTLETGLTITNERISFTVDANDGSAPTLVLDNVTGATSGTSNDLNYITNCDAALMQLELSAANVNYLGRAFLTITDAANHCPVFHEFMILPAVVYDALVAGTDYLDTSMVQILGTAVSTPATAGILDVNLKNISNAAVSTSSAQLGVNAVNVGGTAQTGRDLGASVLLSNGTGTGQISLSSGAVLLQATQTGVTIPTVTTLTNLPAITSNWLTAAGLATDAVDEIVDGVWDEVLTAATHNVASSSGRRLRTASGGQLDSGTAQAGGADTITLATSASTTAGLYVGCLIVIDGGTGVGQSRYIVGYTAGRVASVARHWVTAPDATSTYVLYADNQVLFVHMGLAQGGDNTSITFQSTASSTDDIYVGQCVRVLSGTGDDQIRLITDYNGTTKVATVDRAWEVNPDSTSYYGTLMFGHARVADMNTGVMTAAALATDAVTEITDAILASGDVDTYTVEQTLKLILAALAGKISGADTTTVTIRSADDTADRIVATVDTSGNRSALTLNAAG